MKPRFTVGAITWCSAAMLLSGACGNGSERAPGTPFTDITRTSTETYAKAKPYHVLTEQRDGSRITATINVSDLGHAEPIAREAVNDLKRDVNDVVVTLYDAETRPPAPPWGRAEWTSGGGFKLERAPQARHYPEARR